LINPSHKFEGLKNQKKRFAVLDTHYESKL
jgi:hypothetical protein